MVGPNGCGKSNISDAIIWVLGEQSAKSLRGLKMEDVIFSGTRERKPTGMAEVSLTLVDPEVYDGADLAGDEGSDWSSDGSSERSQVQARALDLAGDWDETQLRRQKAEETEEAVREAQPGVVIGIDGSTVDAADLDRDQSALQDESAEDSPAEIRKRGRPGRAPGVVLKIRRRRFGRSLVRAGEITITRRLFRSGDSEYLLNGKICRLRDIQDIFMGTGLGGETYAIISQERIGQILSTKPMDRRAIIEEAAGITRFKTKKRLAELRLESAKVNLSRVNDIFEEVTHQMNSLKRQASKAERYSLLRDDLRARLRVVLASRMSQLDAEQSAVAAQIAVLAAQIAEQSASVDAMDAEHTAGVERGYQFDQQIREAGARANHSAVELERITARMAANTDRVAELTARIGSRRRRPRSGSASSFAFWPANWRRSAASWRTPRRRRRLARGRAGPAAARTGGGPRGRGQRAADRAESPLRLPVAGARQPEPQPAGAGGSGARRPRSRVRAPGRRVRRSAP